MSSRSATETVELPGVLGDASGEIAGLAGFHRDVVPLQGDGQAEDRGERRSQVV